MTSELVLLPAAATPPVPAETLSALAAPPPDAPSKRSLFDLEQGLACLLDTEEMVPAEQEQEFAQELQKALETTVAKRDRVGQFFVHLEALQATATEEIKRLQKRKSFYEQVQERLEQYVIWTIQSLEKDAKGRWQKLTGRLFTFSLHKCPQRVDDFDRAAIPPRFKTITITLPAELWERLTDSLDLDLRAELLDASGRPEPVIQKVPLLQALKANEEVPGARIAPEKHSLKRS